MKASQAKIRDKRHRRVRAKINGTPLRPRLFVFKSHQYTYAGLVDDTKHHTFFSYSDTPSKKSDKKIKGTKVERAYAVGETLGKQAKKQGIKRVVFDRGGYRYHGRVKAVAEGARKAGIIF